MVVEGGRRCLQGFPTRHKYSGLHASFPSRQTGVLHTHSISLPPHPSCLTHIVSRQQSAGMLPVQTDMHLSFTTPEVPGLPNTSLYVVACHDCVVPQQLAPTLFQGTDGLDIANEGPLRLLLPNLVFLRDDLVICGAGAILCCGCRRGHHLGFQGTLWHIRAVLKGRHQGGSQSQPARCRAFSQDPCDSALCPSGLPDIAAALRNIKILLSLSWAVQAACKLSTVQPLCCTVFVWSAVVDLGCHGEGRC